jgi:hypothetical protein
MITSKFIDADRLDPGRMKNRQASVFLCTPKSEKPTIIKWAQERSISDYLTVNILEEFLGITINYNEIS